ncbi:MAG: PAS domain S-box protein [Bacteroidales bacterium]|nr:PAS domain S-box protein [Bacteroidales bacterium]
MERLNLLINNFETLNKELKIVSTQLKKENKEFYNSIVENSTNYIAVIQEGKFVFINSKGLQLLRCTSSADIIGKNILDTIHADYQYIVIDRLATTSSLPVTPVHLKNVRFDKTFFDTESNLIPFVYNKKPATLIISRNITPDLEYNTALQIEEKLRADILNSFKEVIAFYSINHNIIWLNDAGKKQLNIKDDSYVGELCHNVWFNNNKPCMNCPVVSRVFVPTERIVTLNDNRIWMVRHTPLFDDNGTLTGFVEYRSDITEKENTKNELERSHARQIRAEIANSFGHIESDLTTGLQIWSHGAYNIFGHSYSENQTSHKENFVKYIHHEDSEQVKQLLQLTYNGKKNFDFIFRIIDANDREKTVRGIGEVRIDTVTKNKKFFGVLQDITHISNLEKQIFDERQKYKMLAENAPLGLILTQNNKPVYINKTTMSWLDLKSLSDFEKVGFVGLFHPNDRKIAEELSLKLKENDVPSPLVKKLRILNNDGSIRYIRLDLVNNSINNQKYIQTVLIDITSDVLKEKKQKQVAADALYMNQKNTILSEIESVLIKTLDDKKFSKNQKDFKKIFDIINSYKQLDKDWKMLIANFEEVHPDFFSKLKKMHPMLSSNDIKHCACIKMNFETKEIARFFNIKASSVQIGRVRLKKKMNLSDSIDLRSYILSF